MDLILNYWQTFGRIGQSVVAVVAAILLYMIIRFILLHRLEKLAGATSNDLDDRLVHFVKQFLWIMALFATAAVVLKINHIICSG